MSKSASKWIFVVSFLIAAAGFLLPFWPLSVVGILLAAFSGRWVSAIVMGVLFDLAWGAPLGRLHFLYVPFTILAVAASLARSQLVRYIRPRPPDVL